jgi:hypothetical protein
MRKPRNLDEYRLWALKTLGLNLTDVRLARIYDTNVNNVLTLVTQHPFFVGFSAEAARWGDFYHSKTNSDLFLGSPEPHLIVKPFRSVEEKTYRINVLRNSDFPGAPPGGWVDQTNLYSRLNDLVRGMLICRFADAPEFVTTQILDYAGSFGLANRGYSQEREDGYYAFHSYVTFEAELFDADWNAAPTAVEVEIQITTQLQEVLRNLTHPLYERRRLQSDDGLGKWKWDFTSTRFRFAYLSHTLHLLESMILESRGGALKNKRSLKRARKPKDA